MTLLDISSWWDSIAGLEKIFWGIALVFSLLFLVQTILSFASGDGDSAFGSADTSIDHDGGIDYGYFTIKNFIAFFTIFGWTGIALLKGNLNKGLVVALSLLAGVLVVSIMVLIFRSMSKLKQSGTLDIRNAVDKMAQTYLFIPAKRAGFGKVHIKIQGSLHELQAITDDDQEITTGKLVRVVSVVNDSVLVVTSKVS